MTRDSSSEGPQEEDFSRSEVSIRVGCRGSIGSRATFFQRGCRSKKGVASSGRRIDRRPTLSAWNFQLQSQVGISLRNVCKGSSSSSVNKIENNKICSCECVTCCSVHLCSRREESRLRGKERMLSFSYKSEANELTKEKSFQKKVKKVSVSLVSLSLFLFLGGSLRECRQHRQQDSFCQLEGKKKNY